MSKFIAIDLDPQGVFAVSGSARGGNARVEHAVAWDGTDGDGPPPLTAETAKRLGEGLRDRLRAAGVGPAPALVVIDRDRVVLKELRYPAVPPTEEPNVVRFQAVKELSDSPDDIILDYVPLAGGGPEGERRSMAVAVRKEVYAAVQAMCAAAGLKLVAVTPRPYAVAAELARAFATGAAPAPENKADSVATLTLGAGGGEFTVTRGGEVAFTRPIKGPALASETMLLAEVRRNLTTYAGSNPAHPIQALYVAEADGRWSGRLRAALGIPVHPFDPLAGSAAPVPEPGRGRFAGAVGLLAAKGAEAVPINFAAPRQPRAPVDPKRNQLAAAALAAVLVLGVGGAWGFFTLDAADKEVAELSTTKQQLEQQLSGLEPDAKRLAAAQGWKARQVVWLDELFDMTDRFPAAGGFYASSFLGKAIPPDPKTGKQESQATIDLKVTHRDPAPVNELLAKINRDNTDPKHRYYVGVDKVVGGPAQGDPSSRESTVTARVNARPPAGFGRFPSFAPPDRKKYPPPPGGTTAAPDSKEK